jgi:hypothetical protein
MPRALSKSKPVRVLLALLLIQVVSFASSGGAEDMSFYASNPNLNPNPSPPATSRLSYTMLDVVDSADNDPSGYAWKILLEEMKPIIGRRLQDEKRVVLKFLQTGCSEPNRSCDTVGIYKEKDEHGVIRYKVFIHCNTPEQGATSTNIDAVDKQDVMDMIADFIGSHDDAHVYRAEKQNY